MRVPTVKLMLAQSRTTAQHSMKPWQHMMYMTISSFAEPSQEGDFKEPRGEM